ncbi:archaellin/type IV pilin N-terminal domain-containing protein [Methanoculleus bourgensis]|uniref:Flagellin n=1 Tax=Methanoculleus bourgensis TaxID=83986 RepID=A0A0X3BNH7_9EURY|nr:archaellin/type IV pilin N-terminal domain-containing protein [Methanoculleus bourgensis]CVK33647.1 putative flagellin 1 [Methanoculleus bourgensis]
MSKLVKNEDAFTGLEAAIVLIAFIVVAAVFSYVMLGAGFFATGEAQRVVQTGVAQASSNLELSGPVIVTATSSSGGAVAKISFLLQLAAGGASVDMKKVTFTVSTAKEMETYTYGEIEQKWYAKGVEQKSTSTPPLNDMLDKFEMVRIDITSQTDKTLPTIGVNDRFTVEVKPDIGAALPINRMAPPDLYSKNNYEVY